MREITLALALMMGAGAAAAQDAAQPAPAPRVPATHSVEDADAKLAKVAQDRAQVHAEFADSERECYTRFFVNACLDKAKEKRRVALSQLRAVEVEANHFKREDSVAKRDAELAERARKDAEEQAARLEQPPKPAKVVDDTPRTPPSGPTVAERQAEHDAKVKRQEAEDAANAGKRAANRAAYEKKKEESVQRQAEVARKKEEAEQKRQAQEEAERKKAASAPAKQ